MHEEAATFCKLQSTLWKLHLALATLLRPTFIITLAVIFRIAHASTCEKLGVSLSSV